MPFRKRDSDRGGQEGKKRNGELKQGYHGKNFPSSPRAGSPAGVLGKDRDKGKPDGDGYCIDARNPHGRKGTGWRPNGVMMAWLQRLDARQTASVSNQGNETDPHLRDNSAPMEPKNSERRGSHDSSSWSGEDACLPPYYGD